MSQAAFSQEIENTIGYTVSYFIRTHALKQPREDLIAEARLAAWRAVKTYDETKNAKLKTYVVNCVSNRLRDLRRRETAKRRVHIDIPLDPDIFGSTSTDELIALIDLKARVEKLSGDKRKIVEMIINGQNKKQIFSEVPEAKRLYEKCSTLILQR